MPKYAFGVGLALIFTAVNVVAKPFESNKMAAKQTELKSVQAKLQIIDHNNDQLQAKQSQLEAQLLALDANISKQAMALKALQEQVDQKKQALAQTEHQLASQQARIVQHEQALKTQIQAAYRAGRNDRLLLMLNQQDQGLASRIPVYYDYLNKARLQKVAQIQAETEQLKQLQEAQQQAVDRLDQAVANKEAVQTHFAETKQARMVVLAELNQSLVIGKNQWRQLKQNEQGLKQLLGQLEAEAARSAALQAKAIELKTAEAKERAEIREPDGPKMNSQVQASTPASNAPLHRDEAEHHAEADSALSLDKSHTAVDVAAVAGNNFNALKGRLAWPVAGNVHKQMNQTLHENGREGVLIEATEGNPVRAVASGRVVYAGQMRGYGMLTIASHGNGYMTVYAFNQSLFKKNGESVKAGEVIASVGQSGGRNSAGLYFEIRKQGQPLNPELWCRH